jgi:hypothetical protein
MRKKLFLIVGAFLIILLTGLSLFALNKKPNEKQLPSSPPEQKPQQNKETVQEIQKTIPLPAENEIGNVNQPAEAELNQGKKYFVNPQQGNDSFSGLSADNSLETIQQAIDLAQPGETVILSAGIYNQDFITKRSGTKERPITIQGSTDAIIKGNGADRVIQIFHHHIILKGFTVDGKFGTQHESESYRNKLIYVLGQEKNQGITGLKIQKMNIQNARGECIRLRYFANNNEISYNNISHCGVEDFVFDEDGKNGEGIYIGTAPEQTDDGKNPTEDPDQSNHNHIHHNNIDTQGNECVDIKEGSSRNIVEYNRCTGQKDEDSGGLGSRGNNNIFRYNLIYGNEGAGIRLGGDTEKDGIENEIYYNIIRDNKVAGIKIQRMPQTKICGNQIINNNKEFTGEDIKEVTNYPVCD